MNMEDPGKILETLLERTTEFGKTSVELFKLKAIEKTSEIISSFIPKTVVIVLMISFILFFSFGLAFYLGDIFNSIGFGFFAVSALYGIVGIILHFLMHKWFKRVVRNFINEQLLK